MFIDLVWLVRWSEIMVVVDAYETGFVLVNTSIDKILILAV